MKKKLLLIILALACVLTLTLGLAACHGGDSGDGSDDKTTSGLEFNAVDGGYEVTGTGSVTDPIIKIPAQYNGKPVVAIGERAFWERTLLTSVTIPDSVTEIGKDAFNGCNGLKNLVFGNGVTEIGESAFSGCSGLLNIKYTGDMAGWCQISGLYSVWENGSSDKKVYVNEAEITGELIIPNSVTEIADYAFYKCGGLTSVTIPDGVTAIGVTLIGKHAFAYCDKLTSITVPDSVKSIGDSAFSECSGLTSLIIGNGVTEIGYSAFYKCSGLTSVTIPNRESISDLHPTNSY